MFNYASFGMTHSSIHNNTIQQLNTIPQKTNLLHVNNYSHISKIQNVSSSWLWSTKIFVDSKSLDKWDTFHFKHPNISIEVHVDLIHWKTKDFITTSFTKRTNLPSLYKRIWYLHYQIISRFKIYHHPYYHLQRYHQVHWIHSSHI